MASSIDPKESERFRQFLAADWFRWLSEYPELATAVGHPGFNDRWTDDSATGRETRQRHLTELATALPGFAASSLGTAERFDLELYRRLVDNAVAGLAFGFDPLPFELGEPANLWMPLNQMDGLHLTAASILDQAPKDRPQDFDDRIARLTALPAAVDHLLSALSDGVRRGYTPPRIPLTQVPEQIQNLIPDDPMASGLLVNFRELPTSFGPSTNDRLRREARAAYLDHVRPAFEKLHRYVAGEYVPHCRTSVGASALPDGARMYEYLARRNTTTDLTPAQIHAMGLAEVERLRAEMERIMRSTGFTGSFAEFTEFLRTDPRFYWHSPEEIVDGYRVLGKRTDPALPRLFGRLPRLPYGVLPVPAFRERASPGAYYQSGAPSVGRPGYFYANTFDIGTRPKWEMEALSLHEAVPGHHLQIAIAQELEGLPHYRRETGPTAFIEGWGLYAESLGEELGFYTDPYSRFGQLGFDAWRSIRLVVDTGIHALGWSRDRAIEFFRENTGMSLAGISVEVDRYIVWPGQALGYKIGQLKFRELRGWAESKLGARFDVRAFHDLLLGEGPLPLETVEQRVHRWADAISAGA
ncbi:MAG TPA: DUF885 domain-containing protein [Thermoplasmata archaeon]|nr:DUF885 domain-containing protein [Thermoplasmata archaeon]HTW77422.1 DUF885 domain-containing protein [Thermoplasmata archaeon]